MKKYEAFGYILSCNTELPLPRYNGVKDANLILHMNPESQAVPARYLFKSKFQIDGNGSDSVGYYYENESEKWISYKDVCDIYISGRNNRIICYYKSHENLQLAILYLLSDGISTWLRTAGWYVFHSAVLHINNQTIMLCADKGSGKSTLLMSLCNCGGKILSDDLAAVCYHGSDVLTQSSFPYVKLHQLQFGLSRGLISEYRPVLKNSKKMNCMLIPEAFLTGVYAVDCVYHIKPVMHNQKTQIEKLTAMDSFITLLRSIFCGITCSAEELITYQKIIRKIISVVPVYSLEIPQNLMLLPDVVEMICQNGKKSN